MSGQLAAGPMGRVRMPDEMRAALAGAELPRLDELDEPSGQDRALALLCRQVPGLPGLLVTARELVDSHGGVVVENCEVSTDATVALLSAAFGPVDPAGNGIPPRLVFDVTPRRTDSGYSTAGSSRGSGEFWLHTDSANFPVPHAYVTLACVRVTAGHGGESILMSAAAIVGDLVARGQREALRRLADPVFPFLSGHRNEDDVVLAPVLAPDGDRWTVRYRGPVLAQGRERCRLGEAHLRALAEFETTIARADLLEEFVLRPNDLWVLDNRRWVHGRRAFGPDANRLLKRCKMHDGTGP